MKFIDIAGNIIDIDELKASNEICKKVINLTNRKKKLEEKLLDLEFQLFCITSNQYVYDK